MIVSTGGRFDPPHIIRNDRASFGIPYTYAFTGAVLSEAMKARGDTKGADTVMNRVKSIVKAARIEGFPGT